MRKFLYLVVFTLVAACGGTAEKADQQKQGKVELPDHRGQNNEPLSLTSEDQNLNFTGSLLIWNKDATPAQIQRIGIASRETRRIKSDIVNYYYDEVVPAAKSVAESTKSFEVVAGERAAAIRKGYENLDLVRSVLVPVADGWFNKRLGELRAAGSITDADKAHAETMFGAYCEMKLWELAISPLATATYMVRPTPLALCEPYYKEKQYFSDLSLCPVEIPAGGQDFFDCLWKGGILRSALFVEKIDLKTCRPNPLPTDYSSRGEALKSWLSSGLLRRILSDNNRVHDGSKTYSEEFVANSLSGTPYSRQLVHETSPYKVDLEGCRIAMKREDLADPSSAEAWKSATLNDLKFIVESTEDQISRRALKLLPSSGSAVQDGQNYKKLAWYIHAFGERKASPGRFPASYSDSKFNLATGVNLTADPAHETTIKTDPAFSEFSDLDDKLTSADVRARFKSASMKLEDAKKNFATVEKTYKTEKLALLFPNQQESIKAVLDPGVASAFTAFGLNISRRDGLMLVGFKMEESTAALAGCLAVVESAVCPEGSYNAELSFDAVSGRLIVTSTLNEPAAFGLKQREVSKLSTYFSRINETELAGRKLEFQFDLNRLNGNLEFFTGQAFFRDEKGTTLFQGSTSGDNLSQRLSGNR
jgi:hypothetical protein